MATATSCRGELVILIFLKPRKLLARKGTTARARFGLKAALAAGDELFDSPSLTTTTLRLALEIHVKHTQERAGRRRSSILPQWRLLKPLKQRKSDQFEVLFSLLMLLPV